VTLLAFGMVATFMALIMSKRLSPLTALIVVPIVFGLLAGFTTALGPMTLDGIKALAPTGVMLLFAILYFAIMLDAGLFDPFVALVLRIVQGDPARVVLGTAVIALLVSLDGDGSVPRPDRRPNSPRGTPARWRSRRSPLPSAREAGDRGLYSPHLD
jgi:CitMHS family citrate-Mg2+:H+ or citrate-Ca2+:H+ symporter